MRFVYFLNFFWIIRYMWAAIGVEMFGGILRDPSLVKAEGGLDYINSGAYERSWRRSYTLAAYDQGCVSNETMVGGCGSIMIGGISARDKVVNV